MKLCIHRGATQIGGTCVELQAHGQRLLLDIGMPLDHEQGQEASLPESLDLNRANPIAAVAISHPHADHYGLADRLDPATPFLMGAAAERILRAARIFTPSGASFGNVIHYRDRVPIEIGPFSITPYLADHSAYDSYALHVESDGQGVFYSGDFRAHGRKAALFEKLLRLPPSPVDALLMEGTTLAREGTDNGFPTESDLEARFADLFKAAKGMALVWCSGQNIDRLATVCRAAKRSGRQLILDMYTAHILAATENPRLPQAHWEGIRVYLPYFQKRRIVDKARFDVSDLYRDQRIFPEALSAAAPGSVMLFRPSMSADLEKANCLSGAVLVYSMWDGYLNDERNQPFLNWLARHGIAIEKCHTSGHASRKDLLRLRDRFQQASLIPIHTPVPDAYAQAFDNVETLPDGEWRIIERRTTP